jgi:conjugative transfer region protein TrbK
MKPTRTIAFGLLGVAVIAGAIVAGRHHQEGAVSAPAMSADPLSAELTRCRDEGMAAANDMACKEAWATNRARFFGHGTPE